MRYLVYEGLSSLIWDWAPLELEDCSYAATSWAARIELVALQNSRQPDRNHGRGAATDLCSTAF